MARLQIFQIILSVLLLGTPLAPVRAIASGDDPFNTYNGTSGVSSAGTTSSSARSGTTFVGCRHGLFTSECSANLPTGSEGIGAVTENPSGTRIFVATGAAAKNISQSLADQAETDRLSAETELVKAKKQSAVSAPKTSPPRTERVEVRLENDFVLGGLSLLDSNGNVMIGARHLFQGMRASDMSKALKKGLVGLGLLAEDESLDEYAAFEVVHQGSALDAVVLAKRRFVQRIQNKSGGPLTLRALGVKFTSPQEGEHWASWQIGSIAKEVARQYSYGIIPRVTDSYFMLDLPASQVRTNHTTPGSSGAVIWIASREGGKAENWRLGGVIQCILRDHKYGSGLTSAGGVMAIAGNSLAASELRSLNLSRLSTEPPIDDKAGCVPVDRKGAGGW